MLTEENLSQHEQLCFEQDKVGYWSNLVEMFLDDLEPDVPPETDPELPPDGEEAVPGTSFSVGHDYDYDVSSSSQPAQELYSEQQPEYLSESETPPYDNNKLGSAQGPSRHIDTDPQGKGKQVDPKGKGKQVDTQVGYLGVRTSPQVKKVTPRKATGSATAKHLRDAAKDAQGNEP